MLSFFCLFPKLERIKQLSTQRQHSRHSNKSMMNIRKIYNSSSPFAAAMIGVTRLFALLMLLMLLAAPSYAQVLLPPKAKPLWLSGQLRLIAKPTLTIRPEETAQTNVANPYLINSPQSVQSPIAAPSPVLAGSCTEQLKNMGAQFEPLAPFGKKNGCGIANPVLLKSVRGVEIKPAAKLSCDFAANFALWVGQDLQTLVTNATGSPLASIKNMSSYRCTYRAKGKLSYHAMGQAFDFGSMTTRDGLKFSILDDWGKHLDRTKTAPMINGAARSKTRPAFKPDHQIDPVSRIKRDVLLIVADNACTKFNLVLTPHSNKAHANHLHLDMGDWQQCEI